jgi:hypothetical protein
MRAAAGFTKRATARPPHRSDLRRTASTPVPLPHRPFPNPLAICEDGPDGWTLLVNPDTAAAIAVNPTGALIWRLSNGRRTVDDIVVGVRRRFPHAPGSLASDVAALLGTLSEAGFLGEEVTNDQRRGTED